MKHYRYISILFLSFLLSFVVGEKVCGQYIVDFEGDGETKGAYALDTVNLSGLDWDMTEALIGTSDHDWKNGERSARMGGHGESSMTMLENKINGLGTISFEYRRYGTDAQVDWMVEYSTNDGTDWTQIGEDFTAPASDEVQTFSEEVNVTGDVRVRIKRATETGTANRRLNIDDITITDYAGTDPTITLSKSALNFEEVYDGFYSRPQQYNVGGTNLTDDITVTAPSGIEITTTCGSGYTSSITLSQSGGSVSSTTIYARYTSGTVAGNITHTSTDADTKNIAINQTASSTDLPTDYYSSATGTGQTLKWNLEDIINNHSTRGYGDLWTDFESTDALPNGKVWDVYSDKGGCEENDYYFTFGDDQDSGTGGNEEGDVYNREHSFPNSWWGGSDSDTMYTDLLQVFPTDKYLNAERGNYEFGVVSDPTDVYSNGSRLGPNSYIGSPGSTAFEPIDEYKGDIARIYFYIATRYASSIENWTDSPMIDGDITDSDGSVFEEWALNMLLEWHESDPVDQKEMARNDAVYALQGNRNPFIDNPEYVDLIWAPEIKPEPSNQPTDFLCEETTSSSISLSWTAAAEGTTAPDGYLLKWSTGTISAPVDGTAEADGEGVKNIAYGTNSYNVTGLTQNTTYNFQIWSYTNSGTDIDYKLDEAPTTSCTTDSGPCGLETFDNFTETGTSYEDGTFTGQDGSTWTYTQCRGDYEITGKAIMIGRKRTPQSNFYSGTISGGIGVLSFDYMQAFSTNVNLNVLINDVVVGNVTSNDEQGVVKNSGEITVNEPEDFVIKFINENNSDGQVVIDNVEWTCYPPEPAIFVSDENLTGFSYASCSPVSQSYTVSAYRLDPVEGDISIIAPINYEISLNDTDFFNNLDISYIGGELSNTTIYVRLKENLPLGFYDDEEISHTGGGANEVIVTCSGYPMTYIDFDDNGKWTQGSGALTGYQTDHTYDDGSFSATGGPALRNTTTETDGFPGALGTYAWRLQDNSEVEWSMNIASGGVGDFSVAIRRWDDNPSPDYDIDYSTDDGSSWINVTNINNTNLDNSSDWKTFSGTINSNKENIKIRLIAKGTTERIMVDDFYWTCYDCVLPSESISNLESSNVTDNSADISWTKSNDGNYSLIVVKEEAEVTANPVDNNTYDAEEVFGNGTDLGDGNYVVYNLIDNELTLTGLAGGTTYHIKAFPFNCYGTTEAYKTDVPATYSFTTQPSQASGLTVTCTDESSATITWNSPSGNYDGVAIGMRNGTNNTHVLSGDPDTINADAVFGNGHEYGGTEPKSFVVYKGLENSVTVTGLVHGENYRIRAYAFKDNVWASEAEHAYINNLGVPAISNLQATAVNEAITLGWSNPDSECFDEVIIVAHTSSITGTPEGTYQSNSRNFEDIENPDFPEGGKVVYNGWLSPQTITGLTNNTEYFFKLFVRSDNNWSEGVEVSATPADITVLDYGELAILGVNAQLEDSEELESVGAAQGPDEIIFVMFQDFKEGSTLDFTDNGYEREYAGYWGTTEGVVRLKRTGGTIEAGTVISLRGCNGATNPQWGEHFNIYTEGELDNENWEISSLNGNTNFNLTTSGNGDQVWIMQNGVWDTSEGQHRGIYTGKVLYGWSPSGWAEEPGYGTTDQSTMYPGSECSNSNVAGLADQYKVKYKGPVTEAVPREWLNRIGKTENWEGWDNNNDYFNGGSFGNTIDIGVYDVDGNPWFGDDDTDWFNCLNWGTLRVPDEQTSVVVNGSYAVDDVVISGGEAFCADMILDNSDRSVTINTESTTLNIFGDFKIKSGNVFTKNNGTINLYGGWENSGTFSASGGTFEFRGDVQQNIVSLQILEFYNLNINNIFGVVFNQNVQVNDMLTMLSGDVCNEGYSITVGESAGSPGDIIFNSGSIHGNIVRWVPASTTGELIFPLGKPGMENFAYIEFTEAPSSGGTLKAEFVIDIPENYYGNLPFEEDGIYFDNLADEGFWRIDADNGLSGGIYNITLDAGTIIEINDPEYIRILKRDTGCEEWALSGDYSYLGNLYTHSGMSGFSEFALAGNSEDNPLPIELLYFNAIKKDGQVNLEWATASETNNDYFTIERTTNFANIDVVATLPGAGNSSQTNYYSYADNSPEQGVNYYRLKQTDYDGSYEYSSWEAVDLSQNEQNSLRIASIKQNDQQLVVGIETNTGAKLQIQATDLFGRIVHEENIISGHSYIQHIFVPGSFAGNILIIRVSDNIEMDAEKVVLY